MAPIDTFKQAATVRQRHDWEQHGEDAHRNGVN
jgi:hypothetical protein